MKINLCKGKRVEAIGGGRKGTVEEFINATEEYKKGLPFCPEYVFIRWDDGDQEVCYPSELKTE